MCLVKARKPSVPKESFQCGPSGSAPALAKRGCVGRSPVPWGEHRGDPMIGFWKLPCLGLSGEECWRKQALRKDVQARAEMQ